MPFNFGPDKEIQRNKVYIWLFGAFIDNKVNTVHQLHIAAFIEFIKDIFEYHKLKTHLWKFGTKT